MNTSTFLALVGGLTVVSVLGAVFGYQCCKLHDLNDEIDKPDTFRDLYEDNAPHERTPRDLADEYERDRYPWI